MLGWYWSHILAKNYSQSEFEPVFQPAVQVKSISMTTEPWLNCQEIEDKITSNMKVALEITCWYCSIK